MPFVEQEEGYEDKILEGKKVKVYKPRVEVTIKHLKTGREYLSDEEAKADVDSPVTDTTQAVSYTHLTLPTIYSV